MTIPSGTTATLAPRGPTASKVRIEKNSGSRRIFNLEFASLRGFFLKFVLSPVDKGDDYRENWEGDCFVGGNEDSRRGQVRESVTAGY